MTGSRRDTRYSTGASDGLGGACFAVHVVNTAAYAAPVVALALGWLLLAEQITPRTLGGAAVIVIGVAMMAWSASRTQPAAAAATVPPVELEDKRQMAA